MPDSEPEKCPCTLLQKSQAVAVIVAAVGSAVAACLGAWNHSRIDAITERQLLNGERIQQTQQAVQATEKTATETKSAVQKLQPE